MSEVGFINVHAYTSNAQIPLKDVAIAITDTNDNAISLRLTNRNGQLDKPIKIEVPNRSDSLQPSPDLKPYSSVNIYARKENYEGIYVKNVQVFPQTTTTQNLELIPLTEFPDNRSIREEFDTVPQNL